MTGIGFIAHRALSGGQPGTVFATFERSAYLDVGGRLVCLGSPMIDDGPLTVPCADQPDLRTGDAYRPPKATDAVWRPLVPQPARVDDIARALRTAGAIAASTCPAEGLGEFVAGPDPAPGTNRVVELARAPVQRLALWLEDAFDGDDGPAPDTLARLVGLGPGLTPSGDDLLGGVMIAAHTLRRPDVAERVYAVVRAGDTGRISRAHLDAAREGAGAAPLHALLNAVIAGRIEELPARLAALGRMGHCSGFDAFAGCAVALCAWCRDAYSS